MIPSPGQRPPYPGTAGFHHAPNAALLIDFDNVTMGIRSDLGKELKSLLNSEVIRGKVAVQRAYADWRRYPQYIVPLAESSIDLIFAPAYGSSKKNATDLRMAIDAIELVFTRPEIGTFILMTGDSDFSSCVLKLKEYGKYVIGVGMRESSSDLLIQNCDEYYSYHSLSGLTRTGEVQESREDPLVLMKRAALQMEENGDVMRTDRLKQVMLDLDPSFDEKKLGYSKFSRFVQEAANKGVVKLRKGENGQYELVPTTSADDAPGAATSAATTSAPSAPSESRRGRGRDRDRGRDGRRDARPPRTDEPDERTAAATATPDAAEAAATPAPVPAPLPAEVPAAAAAAEAAPAPTPAPAEPERTPARTPARESAAPIVAEDGTGIDQAYSLLQAAVRELTGGAGRSVRDGDVKRKMLDMSPTFDEADLGFSKFTRFLRQAHDAEVIDLQRANGGNYEVSLPASGKRMPAPRLPAATGAPASAAEARTETPAEGSTPSRGRGRGRGSAAAERRAEPAAEAAPAAATTAVTPPAAPAAPAVPAAPAATPTAAAAASPQRGGIRGRRGGRGGASDGPPPILPGQGVQAGAVRTPAAAPAETPAPAAAASPAAAAPEQPAVAAAEGGEEARKKSRRGRRGRGKGRGEAEAAPTADVVAPEAEILQPEAADAPRAAARVAEGPVDKSTARARRGRAARGASDEVPPILAGQAKSVAAPAVPAATPAPAAAPAAPAPSEETAPAVKAGRSRSRGGRGGAAKASTAAPDALAGLPADRAGALAYLTTSYKGVGQKTAESLADAFGDNLFRALRDEPARVREVLGDRRANALLEQWGDDYAARVANLAVQPAAAAKPPARPAAKSPGPRKAAAPKAGAAPRGGSRGGGRRGSGGAKGGSGKEG